MSTPQNSTKRYRQKARRTKKLLEWREKQAMQAVAKPAAKTASKPAAK